MYDPAQDRVTALTNVIWHEFGHMCNLDHEVNDVSSSQPALQRAHEGNAR